MKQEPLIGRGGRKLRGWLPHAFLTGVWVSWVMLVPHYETYGQTVANPARTGIYVNRTGLQPEFRQALKVLGDRLEKPGKERLVLVGALSSSDNPQGMPIRAFWELPGRLRIEMQKGQQLNVIVFDDIQPARSNGPLDTKANDLVETLFYDSAEHFFIGQTLGLATRTLGDYFRMDDGQSQDYSGPFYNVHEVRDKIRSGSAEREQSKLYYLNSETLLIERVRYEIRRRGRLVPVEVRLANWGTIAEQQLPGLITRLEDDVEVMSLTINSAGFGPGTDDGIFVIP